MSNTVGNAILFTSDEFVVTARLRRALLDHGVRCVSSGSGGSFEDASVGRSGKRKSAPAAQPAVRVAEAIADLQSLTDVGGPGASGSASGAETREDTAFSDVYRYTIQALAAAVEANHPTTHHHSVRVADYAVTLSTRLGLSTANVNRVRRAALLHDVGKIGLPDSILNSAGALTPEEFELVKRHPRVGVDILAGIPDFDEERRIILHHHERWDGGGYPAGLAGRKIPLGARLLAVVDTVETMFSHRSYRDPADRATVRRELIRCAGLQFEPRTALMAVEWLDEAPAGFFEHPGR